MDIFLPVCNHEHCPHIPDGLSIYLPKYLSQYVYTWGYPDNLGIIMNKEWRIKN